MLEDVIIVIIDSEFLNIYLFIYLLFRLPPGERGPLQPPDGGGGGHGGHALRGQYSGDTGELHGCNPQSLTTLFLVKRK